MSVLEGSMEDEALFRQIIYTSFAFPLILSVALVLFLVYYLRRRHRSELERKNLLLQQQALIIENQRAVEYERNRIAGEMHDDLGAGLTRIKFLSERALKQADSNHQARQIHRIAEQSNELVTSMSEIIWAMNSRYDTIGNLIGYIRRYSSEYLLEHQIDLEFHATSEQSNAGISAEKRRNIFLVVKEILHNTVKHSDAGEVRIDIKAGTEIKVTIDEVGAKGFDQDNVMEKGNGLFSMQKRMHAIDGEIAFLYSNDNMTITLTAPLENIQA